MRLKCVYVLYVFIICAICDEIYMCIIFRWQNEIIIILIIILIDCINFEIQSEYEKNYEIIIQG